MPDGAEHAVESVDLDDIRAAISNLSVDFILARNNDSGAVCGQPRDIGHPARNGAAPAQKDEEFTLRSTRHHSTSSSRLRQMFHSLAFACKSADQVNRISFILASRKRVDAHLGRQRPQDY